MKNNAFKTEGFINYIPYRFGINEKKKQKVFNFIIDQI